VHRLPRRARLPASLDSDLSQCHTPSFFRYSLLHRSSVICLVIAVALVVVVYHRHRRKAETIFRSWVYLSCGRGSPSFFIHGRRDSFKLTSVQVHRDRWRPSRVGKVELLELKDKMPNCHHVLDRFVTRSV
jgi:hypothetical protein